MGPQHLSVSLYFVPSPTLQEWLPIALLGKKEGETKDSDHLPADVFPFPVFKKTNGQRLFNRASHWIPCIWRQITWLSTYNLVIRLASLESYMEPRSIPFRSFEHKCSPAQPQANQSFTISLGRNLSQAQSSSGKHKVVSRLAGHKLDKHHTSQLLSRDRS